MRIISWILLQLYDKTSNSLFFGRLPGKWGVFYDHAEVMAELHRKIILKLWYCCTIG